MDETKTTDPAAQTGSNDTPTTYTKDDLTRIVQREVSKATAAAKALEAERDAVRAQLAAIEEEKAKAEEAKLSVTERANREAQRQRDDYERRIAEATQRAASEREKRHAAIKRAVASDHAAKLAPQFFTPDLAEIAAERIASALVVIDDENGNERVEITLGAPGDTEPLEHGLNKFTATKLQPFLKQSGGSGAMHGAGSSGGGTSWRNLSPTDRIKAGLGGRG